MDYRFSFYLIIPILISVTIYEYKSPLLHLIRNKILYDDYELLVGVLSARNHYEQRMAIRNSWKGHIENNATLNNRILVKFVIGSEGCHLPLTDCLEEHSCEYFNISRSEQKENIAFIQEGRSGVSYEEYSQIYLQQQLSFKILHPVILTKLGILKDLLKGKGKLRVSLKDQPTEMDVVSASFADEDKELGSHDHYVYKEVQPFMLPKGFEGVVVTEILGKTQDILVTITDVQYNTAGGVIFLQHDDPRIEEHYADPVLLDAITIPAVSFMYNIHDVASLESHIRGKAERLRQHEAAKQHEAERLQAESDRYGDIVFVEVVDVYRSLPQKLLQFCSWASHEMNFNFLVKTDDDSYIDSARILHTVQQWEDKTNTWWGRFRYNWLVEQHGKWSERSYKSMAYPAFACGSGYVLSRDLVQWLAENRHTLHPYQGEDTSMGIWLAAVAPKHIDDPLWQCEAECISDMYATADLSPGVLETYWQNRGECGDPCGCS